MDPTEETDAEIEREEAKAAEAEIEAEAAAEAAAEEDRSDPPYTYYARCDSSNDPEDEYLHVRIEFNAVLLDTLFDAREQLCQIRKSLPGLEGLRFHNPAEYGRLLWEGDDSHELLENLATADELRTTLDDDTDRTIDWECRSTRGDFLLVDERSVEFVGYGKHCDSQLRYDAYWWEIEDIALEHPPAFTPSETVAALAAGIDAEQAYDRLPILADALEEGGAAYNVRRWLLDRMRQPLDAEKGLKDAEYLTITPWFSGLIGRNGDE